MVRIKAVPKQLADLHALAAAAAAAASEGNAHHNPCEGVAKEAPALSALFAGPARGGFRLGMEVYAPAPPLSHYRRCVLTGIQASLGTASLVVVGDPSMQQQTFTAPLACVAPVPPQLRRADFLQRSPTTAVPESAARTSCCSIALTLITGQKRPRDVAMASDCDSGGEGDSVRCSTTERARAAALRGPLRVVSPEPGNVPHTDDGVQSDPPWALRDALVSGCGDDELPLMLRVRPATPTHAPLTQMVFGSDGVGQGEVTSDARFEVQVAEHSTLALQRAHVAIQLALLLHSAALWGVPVVAAARGHRHRAAGNAWDAAEAVRLILVLYTAPEDACAVYDAVQLLPSAADDDREPGGCGEVGGHVRWAAALDADELEELPPGTNHVALLVRRPRGGTPEAAVIASLRRLLQSSAALRMVVTDVVHLASLPSAPAASVDDAMERMRSIAEALAAAADDVHDGGDGASECAVLPALVAVARRHGEDAPPALTIRLPPSPLQCVLWGSLQHAVATNNAARVDMGLAHRCLCDGLVAWPSSGTGAAVPALAPAIRTLGRCGHVRRHARALVEHFAKPAVLKVLLRAVASTPGVGRHVLAVHGGSAPTAAWASMLRSLGASSVDCGLGAARRWLRRGGRTAVLVLCTAELRGAEEDRSGAGSGDSASHEVPVELLAVAEVVSVLVTLDEAAASAAAACSLLRTVAAGAAGARPRPAVTAAPPLVVVHLRVGERDALTPAGAAVGRWTLATLVEPLAPVAAALVSAVALNTQRSCRAVASPTAAPPAVADVTCSVEQPLPPTAALPPTFRALLGVDSPLRHLLQRLPAMAHEGRDLGRKEEEEEEAEAGEGTLVLDGANTQALLTLLHHSDGPATGGKPASPYQR